MKCCIMQQIKRRETKQGTDTHWRDLIPYLHNLVVTTCHHPSYILKKEKIMHCRAGQIKVYYLTIMAENIRNASIKC